MGQYDFDEIINRKNTNSYKFDIGREFYPELPEKHISMWVADMDFACAQPILEGIRNRMMTQRILGYSVITDPVYYETLGKWMKRRYNWEIEANNSLFSSGVIHALYIVVEKLTQKGDGVLFFTPAYHYFYDATESQERKSVFSQLIEEDGYYYIDFDDFEKKAKDPNVKLCILCNPHNPTGRRWKPKELQRIGEICFSNDIFVVSDEIHADFIRNGGTYTPFAKLFPDEKRIITCTAPSKTFNLAGLQLANILIQDPDLFKVWRREHVGGYPNPLSIAACQAAYTYCDDWVDELNAYLDGNFKHFKKRIDEEFPLLNFRIPEATYLAWIDVSAMGWSLDELKHRFIRAGLYVEFEDDFVHGGDGHIRMNLASPRSVIDKAIDIMHAVFSPKGDGISAP